MKKNTNPKRIQKILIANRGEIACRIIKTCHKLGIKSVAVHSDADRNAPFVQLADEAINLGGNTSAESYLVIDKILKAALDSGANAIHPGYGFLSENETFAAAVADKNLIFIGPSPQTIRDMGSKANSKAIMEKAKVPVIPGYRGDDQSLENLIRQAQKIGFPCMVKASAGGGGKGLKRVFKASELEDAITSAKREAKASFGDDTLLIEKYITNPRHIEIQIFGDQLGHVVHLFERECTLQRRHQKVIEEAPSGFITADTRQKMGLAAIKAAKAVNYFGAGTVEFVMDQDGHFYFLEMNTRLQVEHPVTECITGLDLVEWQILVAEGKPLPLTQDDITMSGHAMEARLYAEDPQNSFLPVTGKLLRLDLPALENIRYDMGVTTGSEISVFYDPMLGKITAHAKNRDACINALADALGRISALGTTTNLAFLRALILHPLHRQNLIHTGFIEEHLEELTHIQPNELETSHVAAFCCFMIQSIKNSTQALLANLAGFRISSDQFIDDTLYVKDQKIKIAYRVLAHNPLQLELRINESKYSVSIKNSTNNTLSATINTHTHDYIYALVQGELHLQTPHGQMRYQPHDAALTQHQPGTEGNLTAPLPGKVLKINVKAQDVVKAGQTLMIVEAMKMEHPIKASVDGTVQVIHYRENDTVKLGDVLLELAANDN